MNESFYELIARVLSGEATAEEAASLRRQCSADGNVKAVFEACEQVWNSDTVAFPQYDVDAAWDKVVDRIALLENAVQPARRTLTFPAWARWAAAATVIGLGTTVALLWRDNGFGNPAATQVVATAPIQIIKLTDGSRVTLQKGAKLRYASDFGTGSTREVTLEGVAFFEVTKDAAHPFIVKGESFSVKVLGTSFEVDENANQVAVTTGRVEVAAGAGTIVLTAGESVNLKEGNLQKTVSDGNDLYWKTGTLSFANKSFSEVIEEISRILDVPVQFDPSVLAADRVQSVTFHSQGQSVELMLTDLCRITGSRWTKDDNTYRILRAR